ncbi:MAG: M20/M25/M40 family metallo-hydrolase [Phycisphaerales bacterium]
MLSSLEQRVCREIESRRSDLIADLRLHVSLPTGGGPCNSPALDESRDRLCNRLLALGATRDDVPGVPRPDWLYSLAKPARNASSIPPTAICRRLSRGDSPAVLIAGHLDTVHDPSGPFRDLSIAPGGKTAVGPGCVDMKGGLVIAAAALEALGSVGGDADRLNWSVLLNSDEESGSFHSEPAIRAEAASGRYAAGLALEPATADGGLVVERAGTGQFMIDVRGKAAHVGRDFSSGVSAVTPLAEAIIALSKLSDPHAGRIVNVGPIQGGIATNVVPDHASAWGNVRFATPDDAMILERQLHEVVRSLNHATGPRAPGDGLPRITLHTSFNRAAKPLIPATLALAEQYRAVSEAIGKPLPFSKTAGVCDGNIMQGAGLATIDTVGVRGGGLHTPQEWIELDSLVDRCQMLAVLLLRLR